MKQVNGITNINQTVAILCDGNNIERSIHDTIPNGMVNFDTLIPKLLNGRGLNRLIYFREGKNISYKLAERLHENFFGSVVPCHKSADIPLSIKATQLASKVDTIIIMSGDSDYVELVRHLKNEGVRVEIAAVRATSAKILINETDYFHEITKEDAFTLSPKKEFKKYDKSEPRQAPRKEQRPRQAPRKEQRPRQEQRPRTQQRPRLEQRSQQNSMEVSHINAIKDKLMKNLPEQEYNLDSEPSLADLDEPVKPKTQEKKKETTKKSTKKATKKTVKKATKKATKKTVKKATKKAEKKPATKKAKVEKKSLLKKVVRKVTGKK